MTIGQTILPAPYVRNTYYKEKDKHYDSIDLSLEDGALGYDLSQLHEFPKQYDDYSLMPGQASMWVTMVSLDGVPFTTAGRTSTTSRKLVASWLTKIQKQATGAGHRIQLLYNRLLQDFGSDL
jgi:hypothetical protein